jgi:hypothetical protein
MLKHHSVLFASIGVLIFVAGTLIGRAQQPRMHADFDISITAPTGTITVACLRGCEFQRSEPLGNNRRGITLTDTITSTCPGAEGTTCKWGFSGIMVPGQKVTP